MGAGKINRTRWGAVLVGGLALLTATGCATLRAERPRHPETAQAPAAAQDDAVEASRRFLTAYRDSRHAALLHELSEPLRASFGEEAYRSSVRELSETLGKLESFSFLTALQTPVLTSLVWKARFRRTGKDGRPIVQEALFRVLLAPADGRPRIISFSFI
ncbi:MAG: hypothetical protein ACI4WT_07070 [Oligosphaeraceae bacterium]